MSARKIKGSWWVDFSFRFERLRKRSPDNTKTGAQEYEAFLRRLVAEHGSVSAVLAVLDTAPAARPPTFAEFAERWLRDYVDVNNKPSERRAKRCYLNAHLLPFFGERPLPAIKTVEVEQFKARCLARGLTAKTINNILAVLRKSLATAVEWEQLGTLPRIRLLRAAVPPVRYLDQSEAARLLAAAPEGFWRTFVLVEIRSGLRAGELIALEWEDVNLTTNLLTVRRSLVEGHLASPKSYKTRYVPLSPDVSIALRGLPKTDARVFPVPARDPYRYIARRLRGFYDRAQLPRSGWHILRHTFATELTRLGAHPLAVKELLGHSSLKMTERYAHVAPNTLRQTIALFHEARDSNGSLPATGTPASSESQYPAAGDPTLSAKISENRAI